MAQFISDHSPMDDYQRILSQADYYIENVDYNNRLPYDNREKLNKFPAYKAVFKTMKIMLIISGLSLPAAIVLIWIYGKMNAKASVHYKLLRNLHYGVESTQNYGKISARTALIINSNTLRFVCICSVFIVIGTFVLALLIGSVGAYMESHSEKIDGKTKYIQESKTWVLLNGCVAVADQSQGRGGQMVKRYIMDENNIVDVPFSCMDIIDNVHSVRNNNGKVIADADVTEYYIKHPYVNESPEDDVSHYFHYYKTRKRRKIEWNENMLGIDKLIKALNSLKH